MPARVVDIAVRLARTGRDRAFWSGFIKILAAAAALSLLAPQPAWGAEPTVRAGSHNGYGRLVFEWAQPIEVQGRQEGNRYRLRFARPLAVPTSRALDPVAEYVERVSPGRNDRELVLHLAPGTTVKQETHDRRLVVLDLAPGAGPRADLEVRTGRHDGYGRIVFDWAGPVSYQATTTANQVRIEFNRAAEISPRALGRRLGPWVERGTSSQTRGGSEVRLDLKPGVRARTFQLGNDRVVVDLTRSDQDAAAVAPTPAPAPARAAQATSDPRRATPPSASSSVGGAAAVPLRIDAKASERGVTVDFAWDRLVPAAVFVRAGFLWAVFAAPETGSGGAAELSAPVPGYVGRADRVEAAGGTAIRVPLRRPLAARVALDGSRWRVTLTPEAAPPSPLYPIRLKAPKRLRLAPGEPAALISFTDPEVGDRLGVWPLQTPGLGQVRQRFVDLELMATAQGLAWRMLRDGVTARAADQVVEFVAPGGLLLSDEPDPATATSEPASPVAEVDGAMGQPQAERIAPVEPLESMDRDLAMEGAALSAPHRPERAGVPTTRSSVVAGARHASVMGLADWELTGTAMAEQRRALRRELAAGAGSNDQHLDLARLYLAQGLAAETVGVLGVMDGPKDEKIRLARQVLSGAAALLMGRRQEAEAALGAPALDGDPEVALWRAALAAAESDWEAAAGELERSGEVLASYPEALQPHLGLPAARTAIEVGDAPTATATLERLATLKLAPSDRARVAFLEALAATRTGRTAAAERIWRGLEQGAPSETRVKAGFERARLLVGSGELEPVEALAVLEPARSLWRGLPDEPEMLDGLAHLQAQAGDHPSALRTWRDLLARFPDAPSADQARVRMRQSLIKTLLDDAGAPVGPVQAYGVYREFADLVPGGELGDRLRRGLAERLGELDLVRPAAALLEDLVGGRLEGVDKASAGADLAELWLREPAPEAAISALDRTRVEAPLPPALRERRQLLRARALSDGGRRPDALTSLDGLDGSEADHLRTAILWQERDWPGLVATIEPLLQRREVGAPLPEDEQRLLVQLAVAQGRLGRTAELERLRARFGAAMNGQPGEAAFLMATTTTTSATEPEAVLAAAEDHVRKVQTYLEQAPATVGGPQG